jgi:type II secretory pathway predicted ATPase ExeA
LARFSERQENVEGKEKLIMTPDAALDEQIKRYRKMTGEQRLEIALDLHELSCNVSRAGIRHQHPRANEEEVEKLLRHRLTLARTL